MEPNRPPEPPRHNVELKARLPSIDRARAVARRTATRSLGSQHQVDTYFHCTTGRLKLREINDRIAQLIWYRRPDRPDAKSSEYYLVDLPDPASIKTLLAAALGTECVVRKHRDIYLVDNVRIHLDRVDDLGCFLEFEAVLGPHDSPEQGQAQVARLRRAFDVDDRDLVAGSYREMQLDRMDRE